MTLPFLTFVTLTLTSPLFAAGKGWMTNFETAKTKAQQEKKDILLNFTGSDWCHYCQLLEREVFSQESFNTSTQKNFIRVEIDFPQNTTKISPETFAQNLGLKDQFAVEGFPSIFLLDSKARPYAKTGYQPGGAENYLRHLAELQTIKKERDRILSEAKKLEHSDKAIAIVTALSKLQKPLATYYPELLSQAEKLDPKDPSGFISEQKLLIAEKELRVKMESFLKAKEPHKALPLIDQLISDFQLEGLKKQETLFLKINIFANTKEFDKLDKVVDELISIDPSSRAAEYIERLRPQIEEMKQKAATEKE